MRNKQTAGFPPIFVDRNHARATEFANPSSTPQDKRWKLSGPKGHWLLGSLKELRAGMLSFFQRCRADHGPVVEFRLARRRILLLSEPSLIEEVLVKQNRNFQKHYAVKLLKPVLGNGLLLSEGEFWLRQRRLMQPAFSRQLSDTFAQIVAGRTLRLAQDWSTQPRRDIYRDMTTLTVQVAADALLGVDVPNDLDTIGNALEIIHLDFEQRFQRAFNPPRWVPTASNRRRHRAILEMNGVIGRIIRLRRSQGASGCDALSRLIRDGDKTGNGMSDKQLHDEVMTLLLAGHDTTANALTWSWYLLSQHPEVADKLASETAEVVGDRLPSYSDLEKLRYCRNVFKESMRLYPPVYMFGREAVRDVEIKGIRIRQGTSVLLCQWLVHRDPRFFDRPLEFLPERWNGDFERRLPPYSYFPFGGGPRVCIGQELAMLEGVITLAVLGSRFRVRLEKPETVTPWPTVTLRPAHGMAAIVQPFRNTAKVEAAKTTRQGKSNFLL